MDEFLAGICGSFPPYWQKYGKLPHFHIGISRRGLFQEAEKGVQKKITNTSIRLSPRELAAGGRGYAEDFLNTSLDFLDGQG